MPGRISTTMSVLPPTDCIVTFGTMRGSQLSEIAFVSASIVWKIVSSSMPTTSSVLSSTPNTSRPPCVFANATTVFIYFSLLSGTATLYSTRFDSPVGIFMHFTTLPLKKSRVDHFYTGRCFSCFMKFLLCDTHRDTSTCMRFYQGNPLTSSLTDTRHARHHTKKRGSHRRAGSR